MTWASGPSRRKFSTSRVAFDALIHPRVYKPAYPQDQASDMIVSGACGIFDPLLLACFARHIGMIAQAVYN